MQPKPHRPYELQEYDPAWKRRFMDAAEELRPLFGSNLAGMEHVGSTSVAGMVAKPQIDVLAVVRDLDGVTASHEAFREVGFTVFGRGYISDDDEYMTKDAPDGTRLVSVHTLQEGNPKIEDYRAFRDYLQENEEDRNLYATAKRDAFAAHHGSIQDYYRKKKAVIGEILARAREWSRERHS